MDDGWISCGRTSFPAFSLHFNNRTFLWMVSTPSYLVVETSEHVWVLYIDWVDGGHKLTPYGRAQRSF